MSQEIAKTFIDRPNFFRKSMVRLFASGERVESALCAGPAGWCTASLPLAPGLEHQLVSTSLPNLTLSTQAKPQGKPKAMKKTKKKDKAKKKKAKAKAKAKPKSDEEDEEDEEDEAMSEDEEDEEDEAKSDDEEDEEDDAKVKYRSEDYAKKGNVGIRQIPFPKRQIASISGPPTFRYRKLKSLMDKPRPSL